MKSLLARGGAALLIAAAALTAACASNDPMAPAANAGTNATRSSSSLGDPVHSSGYIVGWGRDSSRTTPLGAPPTIGGGSVGGAAPTSGYIVGWGREEP